MEKTPQLHINHSVESIEMEIYITWWRSMKMASFGKFGRKSTEQILIEENNSLRRRMKTMEEELKRLQHENIKLEIYRRESSN